MVPEGFTARMQALLQEEYGAFAASFDRPMSPGLRRNPCKEGFTGTLDAFHLTPVPWCPTGYYYDAATRPGLSALHEAGLYYLQEPSAMAPVELLDVRPGQLVLDLCAAPGGKSTQIAGKLLGQGLLVCNEIMPKRAQILSSNIERLGIANALVTNEHPKKLSERWKNVFDRVLVDAPCSGEGMFRKEAAAVTDWTEDTNAICANRQLEILHSAAQMVKKGGKLVYSTCTFSPLENEGVICAFLKAHPEFILLDAPHDLFASGRPDWVEGGMEELSKTARLWPHKLRGEGHFAAVLQKTEGTWETYEPEPGGKLPKEVESFCKEAGTELPDGKCVLFADRVLFVPGQMPLLRNLHVMRAGLELGTLKKGRLEPAHAYALWLRRAKQVLDLASDDARTLQYLQGQVLSGDNTGWTLVRVDGISLGWAKGSGGQLKNHYPKALRRPCV